ncbi:MAG: aldo/keto reductase [Spirochaetaceae bacterium]|nr:aldo/keto reductase [Spirochaetaceae bacterium]MDT8297433.1 aldo/keto reductase [Spirochaetaceae bacterium]
MSHIHGIGFEEDELILATHLGLLRFQDGSWVAEESPPHDYMGFAPVEDGAYISGHPSILHADEFMNPLGVMFTEDWGDTLTPKGFYGEVDYHWLTAGYHTTSVYALTSSHPQAKAPMFAMSQNSKERYEREDGKERIETVERLRPLADGLGLSLAQMALAWATKNPNVSTVITGASKPEQVEQNMKALDAAELPTPEIMARIDELAGTKPTMPRSWR